MMQPSTTTTVLTAKISLTKPAVPQVTNGVVPEYKHLKNSYKTLWGYLDTPIKPVNIILLAILHLWALHSFLTFDYLNHIPTIIWGFIYGGITAFGITGGAHRFYTHRSFKATLPLRIILMLCFSASGQNSLYDWVRDHRVHHKFSETDADPHNSNKGFFFAHMGWLMKKKHPEVIRKSKTIDYSDLFEDPVFLFHQKYYNWLKVAFCFVIPILIPIYFWNETFYNALVSQGIARYCISLHLTWFVNSAAHMWGYKPYDSKIGPTENLLVSLGAFGEGWHNYHHTFPWDYKAAELGNYSVNLTTMYLDLFAKIGWAYDLKEPSKELIRKVIASNAENQHVECLYPGTQEASNKYNMYKKL